ncbi:bifunctional diaminohydroxyphosphoribosylaminopyrimidine deaminase/5-amino-6-(5-phosphoribosylamino)uracil reductase RibD [Salinimicrobium sp. TH3]|uniref:bifunctional diaminohydroxyphosphoribosylaminopyrimidine deaminase/5-amino-6-(5-phosphoribosylamino)uracil reductase RibD n=1 Tax=Salinimicrobium sp. TH3 TaxID=2997342 RepID=UPI002276BB8E|nr:bifunctional diaminohydroxyphosphoribosylaminopyrimidine deaminase/5-amino-6-(5-phosphoribosylamino)uracil reductase RibD [Salinimicrobium sp. TH3]MCY2687748.1 bifunctional diaminohydroxyphosphoribosylaminopyrimidine deaminase/5-amino-6-(5-phosphoribosylamino)uracil reductase RibD [Salinimicrobium sp. TH3]
MKIHEKYINRCIQLAQNGLGRTYPNPVVGSVIVYNDTIIGEGWHHKAGEPHAEVNAVNSIKDKSLLAKSTIYVSLEPCSHYGKTPPCSNLIIDSGIKKVVIGTVDPFSKVAGKGIKKLLDAGCEVRVGILEQQCRELNKRFFTFHTKQRPYIILKWAQSSDGFLAPLPLKNAERKPVWITGKYSQQLVHKWRSQEQAIMVGTNTAVTDNPKLNTRMWQGNDPVRLVLDRNLRIPQESHLFDASVKTIILTGKSSEEISSKNVIFETVNFEADLAQQVCDTLFRHEIQSVIIEGGRETLQTFIAANLWDEARIFIGKPHFKEGVKAPEVAGTLTSETKVDEDQLKIYLND